MKRRIPLLGGRSQVRRYALLVLAVALAAAFSVQQVYAAPLETGRADGTVTINGKTTQMKYAWAKKAKNDEGAVQTVVLLSDVALSKRALQDDMALRELTKSGRAHTLQVTIEADKSVNQVELLNNNFEHGSLSSGGSFFEVANPVIGPKGVSAKVKTSAEQEFFDDKWSFDVRFNAATGANDAWGENAIAAKEVSSRSSGVAQGAATGSLTFNGKTYKLTHAYAKTERNAFDKKKQDVVVLLSDQPVEPAAFGDDFELARLAKDGKIHAMVVTVSDEEPYHLQFYTGKESQQISGSGIFHYDSIQYSDKKAEARFFTEGTEEMFNGKTKYAYDVTFNAPVIDLPKPPAEKVVDAKSGTKLPANGGEPWAAYMGYQKAVGTADFTQVSKFLTKDALKGAPIDPSNKKEMKQMMEMMKALRATDIKLVDGYANATQATMHVTGIDPFDKTKRTKGTVTMIKEDGAWKLSKDAWGDDEE